MNRKECIGELLAKEHYGFDDLKLIMDLLRSEGGCPWDMEQTHGSIRSCMIEEAYEVVEAIDTENATLLREELGDVLFQVMFHARIEEEQGTFSVGDVVHDICEKMIRRHPHVFSDATVTDANDTVGRWEAIKTEEKQRTTLSARLRAVPPMLPALMRASKIVKKTTPGEASPSKEAEVLAGSAASLAAHTPDQAALGALLLQTVRYAVSCGLDAEQALGQAVEGVILQVEAEEAAKN